MAAPPDLSNISEGTSGEDEVDGAPAGSWGVQILPKCVHLHLLESLEARLTPTLARSMPAYAGPSSTAALAPAPPVASTSTALAGPA